MLHRAKLAGMDDQAPKNQINIQINNAADVEKTIEDTRPGMLEAKQLRSYEDPAAAASLERQLLKLQTDQIPASCDEVSGGGCRHTLRKTVNVRLGSTE